MAALAALLETLPPVGASQRHGIATRRGVTTMGRRTKHTTAVGATVLLIIVVAATVIAAGCGSSADAAKGTLKLEQADDGKTYAVKTGDAIQVVIPGNPTTGYSWTAALADKDAALLQQVGDPQYAADSTESSLVGSGGVYTLTFKAVAKGQALLKLVYARPWESAQPIQTFTAILTIE
jgi:predicted secreted protein